MIFPASMGSLNCTSSRDRGDLGKAAGARRPNPSQQQRQSGNSSASARATRARPTNSTSRPRSSLPMLAHRAASSCSTRRCCQGDPYDGHTLGALIEDTPKGLRAWNRIARLAGPSRLEPKAARRGWRKRKSPARLVRRGALNGDMGLRGNGYRHRRPSTTMRQCVPIVRPTRPREALLRQGLTATTRQPI
jgi:hypothetical protein